VRFRESRLVKNGTTRGHRQALCRACGSSIALTYGTPYFDVEHDPPLFELAIRALAEGNSIRATARIIQVDKDTVCTWLDRAAQQCRLVILYLWQQLPLRECQLDELWSFVHTKDEPLAWAKTYHDTSGDAWGWVAFAPEWRLVVAFVVGKRTQAEANLLLERVAPVTTDLIPLFYQRSTAGIPHRLAACVWRMVPAATAWTAGPTPPSTACAPQRAALCPSSEDARAGSRGGGRPSRRVWRRPTHCRALGHTTDECDHQYQLCRTRASGAAPTQSSTGA
jgi:hypothetical protein